MGSHQAFRPLPHPLKIQGIIAELAVQSFHWVGKAVIPYPVHIGFLRVTVSRMKIQGHFLRTPDPDILRQAGIQGIGDLLPRDPGHGIEYSHISQSMHSRICPGCADHADLLPEQIGQLPVQHLLDGDPVGLQLPSAVCRTIIGDNEFYPFYLILPLHYTSNSTMNITENLHHNDL